MPDYTAEDGLNVLNYLGITNITDEEKEVFRGNWNRYYRNDNGDLIGTTWTLYAEALPFICGHRNLGSAMTSRLRDSNFGKRLETTELDKELKQGVPLEQILKKGPREELPPASYMVLGKNKFYNTVKLE